jgi:hypothetical protein
MAWKLEFSIRSSILTTFYEISKCGEPFEGKRYPWPDDRKRSFSIGEGPRGTGILKA